MQSKVILITTAILIIAPAVFFFAVILAICLQAKDCWHQYFSL